MSHRIVTCSLGLNLIFCALFLGGWLGTNVETTFNPTVTQPILSQTSTVHPMASVIGSVKLGQRVFVAPFASIRGDEGQNIYIGDESNVQDGVVIHGLETFESGKEVSENEVEVDRWKYSVHIGQRVSIAPSVARPCRGGARRQDHRGKDCRAPICSHHGGDYQTIRRRGVACHHRPICLPQPQPCDCPRQYAVCRSTGGSTSFSTAIDSYRPVPPSPHQDDGHPREQVLPTVGQFWGEGFRTRCESTQAQTTNGRFFYRREAVGSGGRLLSERSVRRSRSTTISFVSSKYRSYPSFPRTCLLGIQASSGVKTVENR